MPDTIRSEKPDLEDDEWKAVKSGLQQALEQVNGFRHQEGKSLDNDLRDRVSAISEKLVSLQQYEEDRINHIHGQFTF